MMILLQLMVVTLSGVSTFESTDGRFYFFADSQTYLDAKNSCEANGMELATASTKDDYQALANFLLTNITSKWNWIGLQLNTTENNYQWIDGTFMDVVNWGPNEPSSDPYKACAFIDNEVKKWATGSCGDQKRYVCVDFNLVPVYTFGLNNVSFVEAQQRCLQNKSSLPIIITKTEENRLNDFLDTLDLPRNEELWIGLYRDDTDGEYKWINGEELADFYKWVGGNGTSIDIHLDSKLHAFTHDGFKRTYICQKKSKVVLNSIYKNYELEAINAYPLSLARQEVQVKTDIECARYCLRDKGCFKFTLGGSNCLTYGDVRYSTNIGGLSLYKRLLTNP